MRLTDWVQAALEHRRGLYNDDNDELIGMMEDAASDPTNPDWEATLSVRIAERLESQADHLEVGWLPCATSFLLSPDVLRAQAACWRRAAETGDWGDR